MLNEWLRLEAQPKVFGCLSVATRPVLLLPAPPLFRRRGRQFDDLARPDVARSRGATDQTEASRIDPASLAIDHQAVLNVHQQDLTQDKRSHLAQLDGLHQAALEGYLAFSNSRRFDQYRRHRRQTRRGEFVDVRSELDCRYIHLLQIVVADQVNDEFSQSRNVAAGVLRIVTRPMQDGKTHDRRVFAESVEERERSGVGAPGLIERRNPSDRTGRHCRRQKFVPDLGIDL